jgi:hypothetical protein
LPHSLPASAKYVHPEHAIAPQRPNISSRVPASLLIYRNFREAIFIKPAVQQTGRCKRLTGVAPRAIWAALWIQSS